MTKENCRYLFLHRLHGLGSVYNVPRVVSEILKLGSDLQHVRNCKPDSPILTMDTLLIPYEDLKVKTLRTRQSTPLCTS